jgi:glycine betaine/choline ABC-type transport system substrate-binding protein
MMFLYDVLGTPTRRLFLAAVASSTLARAGTAARPVVVGSKLDLEGGLLGEMMLLALSRAKIVAENRLRIGPTSILRSALLSGVVDLCPEYTGKPLFSFMKTAILSGKTERPDMLARKSSIMRKIILFGLPRRQPTIAG